MPGRAAGLAEVPVAGGELPQARQRKLRHRQDLRLLRGHRGNTKIVDNPARKNANATIREAEKDLATAERDLAVLLADPAVPPAVKNEKLIPAAERKIAAARRGEEGVCPGRCRCSHGIVAPACSLVAATILHPNGEPCCYRAGRLWY
jgi:hypothetical protein